MKMLKLSRRSNVARMYTAWWDIYNLTFVVLLVLLLFIAISLAMIGAFDVLGAAALRAQFQNSSESGLKLLGIAISGAIAAGLWILNKGIDRWAVINRVHHLHTFTLNIVLRQASDFQSHKAQLRETIDAYADAAKGHFTTISSCHPSCQNYYEELRFIVATISDERFDEDIVLAFSARVMLIALMTKGYAKLMDDDDALLMRVAADASDLEKIAIRFKPVKGAPLRPVFNAGQTYAAASEAAAAEDV